MKHLTTEEKDSLNVFMQENNLTKESKLYRYTSNHYLKKIDDQLFLEAKSEPIDMVIDRYHGFSEVSIASEIGQGLSFLSDREDEYDRSDRVCVELKLKDVLDQGSLVYTVTSLPAYLKAFFCTLPEGLVKIKVVS
jgi:hypothetical protein